MLFKENDIVKIIQTSSKCLAGFKVGDVCEILAVTPDQAPFYTVRTLNSMTTVGYANTQDLELIDDTTINNLQEVTLELTIQPPEGYTIDEENSTFQLIKFKKVEKKEVKCWEDLNIPLAWATKEQEQAEIALKKLSQLMKEINGSWKPNWSVNESKDVITYNHDRLETPSFAYAQEFLAFPERKLRDEFLENHRELIEQAKPLL